MLEYSIHSFPFGGGGGGWGREDEGIITQVISWGKCPGEILRERGEGESGVMSSKVSV